MNNNLKIGGIFCDLQKAFDCMDHKILMNKLEFYGTEVKFKTLIASYLTGRHQKVTLNNNTNNNSSSKWEMIKNGVPQGSFLGPLFFLLYINYLPKIITKDNSMVLFADNTSLLITGFNKLDCNINITQSLHSIISWFNSNLLILNFDKTHYVEFRTKNYYQVETILRYEQKDISSPTETKFLGLIIDETLSWNQHNEKIATKLCSACYTLRNLKHIVPQSALRTIYYAYIHSILSYGIIFWGRSSSVNKLFILQKKIVSIITNSRIRESCREAFKNMQIVTLYSQYIFSPILFTVKNKPLFTPNNEIHKYKTRNNTNLHLPTVNITKYYKGPCISGLKAFDHLPLHIKSLANDMKSFKTSLKRFLYHYFLFN
jgi:hypothetical protein